MKKMVFVKNTTEERRRKLQGEKRKQQAVCKTYVFFGTKSFASSRAFSCTKTREAAGIATYWQPYIKIDHYTYQCHCVSCRDVPTRSFLWEKVNETNDGTRAHLRRAGSGHRLVEPVMRVHIESKVCIFFYTKLIKKYIWFPGFQYFQYFWRWWIYSNM